MQVPVGGTQDSSVWETMVGPVGGMTAWCPVWEILVGESENFVQQEVTHKTTQQRYKCQVEHTD